MTAVEHTDPKPRISKSHGDFLSDNGLLEPRSGKHQDGFRIAIYPSPGSEIETDQARLRTFTPGNFVTFVSSS